MHNQFKTQKFKHLMLAMGPRDLNSAPYSPVHCSSHSMTSFQPSELTELPVVENSQLFAQRVHSARTAHGTPPQALQTKRATLPKPRTIKVASKPCLTGYPEDSGRNAYYGAGHLVQPAKLAKKSQQIGKQIGGPIFGKTGARCPGSQSQAPNTPSLWLLSSWSHVETQNISQFLEEKINCLSVCTWSLSIIMAVHGSGPVLNALTHTFTSVDSIPGPMFFILCHLSC